MVRRLGAGSRDAAAARRVPGRAHAGLARVGPRLAARRHRQAPPAPRRHLRRLLHALLHHGLLRSVILLVLY